MPHFYEELLSLLAIPAVDVEKQAKLGNGIIGKALKYNRVPLPGTLLKIKTAFPKSGEMVDKMVESIVSPKLPPIQKVIEGAERIMHLSESAGVEEGPTPYERSAAKLEKAREALNNPKPKAYNPKVVEGPINLTAPDEPLPDAVPITEDRYAAGTDGSFTELCAVPIGYMQSAEFKGCTRIIKARGNSMEGVFSSDDLLGVEDLIDYKEILMGHVYALNFDTYAVVKYLRSSDKGPKYVRLCSENKTYEDVHVMRSEIRHLAIVRIVVPFSKIIRLY